MVWVILLATWEAAYRVFHWKPHIFASPSRMLDSTLLLLNVQTGIGERLGPHWPHMLNDWTSEPMPWMRPGASVWNGLLVSAPLVSGVRLLAGFVLSIILGSIIGVLMWRWSELDQLLGPLFLGMQTLPSVCWVPLAIISFGINETSVLFVLVMGSFFAIAIALRDGLRTIPPLYQRAGQMLGAKGWKLYWYVLLPASMPAMASSLRQGFSFAWRSLMGAELILIVSRHGLGYLLELGRVNSDTSQVVMVMLIMVMIGMAMDRFVFARLQERVQQRFGLAG
jgi:NitT/TauT family transport system permease protein